MFMKPLVRLFFSATLLSIAVSSAAAADLVTVQVQPNAGRPQAPQACSDLVSPTEIPSASLINFDDLANGAVIGDFYKPVYGVSFSNTPNTQGIIYGNEPAKAHSRPNVAANNAVFPVTSAGQPFTITFDQPKTYVGMYIGNGQFISPAATLSAYNAAGGFICAVNIAQVPEPVNQFIGIHDTTGQIRSVALDYGNTALSEAIDDLYFSPPKDRGVSGTIAYVYRGNTPDANAYYSLLTSRGYGVTLIPLGLVTSTNFSLYSLTMIADDTGSLNTWGLPGQTTVQVAKIVAANKPIIGLGEGGYAFFGRLPEYVGWPNGWHGPDNDLVRAASAPPTIYSTPNSIPADPVRVYTDSLNTASIYMNAPPSDVFAIGDETPKTGHSPVVAQNCHFLWGYGGSPVAMTPDGQNLMHNLVEYARVFQCPTPQPPPAGCIDVSKTANPAAGTAVIPGTVIQYTLTYTHSNSVNCATSRTTAKLVDTVPLDTVYVPNSASDGISPAPDQSLAWDILAGSSSGVKTFKVQVLDTQCHNQRTVNNRAGMLLPGYLPKPSNVVSHPVNCPPVTFPNDQPPYAEDEVQIHPYPIIAGQASTISVRLTNNTATATTVVVSFQTSPDKFGIGLSFGTIASKTVTIPANSNVIVQTPISLFESGHYCIQVRVDIPGYGPIFTQRNLDVTENLTPGKQDTLNFKVSNPTTSTTDIALVVVNTCPGWTAVVSPSVLMAMAPGEVRNAQLLVTPPNPIVFGSGCHIDVQGWLLDGKGNATTLLGGIRKLDVPPVSLPHDVQPSWLEPEISVKVDPPVVGVANQICVELQNPLPFTRVVTLSFAVADFGAGIPFTTIATQSFTLPPNSNAKYCVPWTPAAGGTLHRCILVTLKQPGYQDQHSQRNINLRRGLPRLPLGSVLTFTVGNPDLVTHTLQLIPTLYGIDPYWKVILHLPGLPDPPPDLIGPGEILALQLELVPAVLNTRSPAAPPSDYRFGDVSRVDVQVVQDGTEVGGFTVQLSVPQLYLPLVAR